MAPQGVVIDEEKGLAQDGYGRNHVSRAVREGEAVAAPRAPKKAGQSLML